MSFFPQSFNWNLLYFNRHFCCLHSSKFPKKLASYKFQCWPSANWLGSATKFDRCIFNRHDLCRFEQKSSTYAGCFRPNETHSNLVVSYQGPINHPDSLRIRWKSFSLDFENWIDYWNSGLLGHWIQIFYQILNPTLIWGGLLISSEEFAF